MVTFHTAICDKCRRNSPVDFLGRARAGMAHRRLEPLETPVPELL
jgi:hypothetical protein